MPKIINNKYEIIKLLGEGGMSIVYLAKVIETAEEVAIKILKPQSSSNIDRNVALGRFEREAKALQKLKHKNVLRFIDFDYDNNNPYLVTEYIAGRKSIKDHLKTRGKLMIEEAIDITIQLCEALSYVHQIGVLHRDIKPDNVMLRPDNTVILMDFGIAVYNESESYTATNIIVGSISYLPPEAFSQRTPSPKNDIYALGITLYQMLVGSVPFTGDNAQVYYKVLNDKIPLINNMDSTIPTRVDEIIAMACHKDQTQRYQSMGLMLKDLIEFKESGYSDKKKPLFMRFFGRK